MSENRTVGSACVSNSDCADATSVHGAAECSYQYKCRCRERAAFGGETCAELTALSFWPIALNALLVLQFTLVAGLASVGLWRVVARRKRGFLLTTAGSTWLAALFCLGFQLDGLLFVSAALPGFFTVHDSIYGTLVTGTAVFGVLSALNVSLMWIEFAMASQRLVLISNNLKMTRGVLLGCTGLFLVLAAVSLVIRRFNDTLSFLLLVGLCMVTAVLLSVAFFVGARRMSAVYSRMSRDLEHSIDSRASVTLQRSSYASNRTKCAATTRSETECSEPRELEPPPTFAPAAPQFDTIETLSEQDTAAAAEKAEAAELAAMQAEDDAANERDRRQASSLDERSRQIVTTARLVCGGLGTFVFFSILFNAVAFTTLKTLGVIAFALCTFLSMQGVALATAAIARFILQMTPRVRKVAPAAHGPEA